MIQEKTFSRTLIINLNKMDNTLLASQKLILPLSLSPLHLSLSEQKQLVTPLQSMTLDLCLWSASCLLAISYLQAEKSEWCSRVTKNQEGQKWDKYSMQSMSSVKGINKAHAEFSRRFVTHSSFIQDYTIFWRVHQGSGQSGTRLFNEGLDFNNTLRWAFNKLF